MATIATLSWDDDSDAPDNMSFVAADTPSARSEKAAERNAGASIPPQGPVLLALPAMKRNPDLVFDVFEELPPQRAGAASGSDRRKRRRIVVGETDRVQIGGRTADSGTIEPTYLVAVWDPDTGVATIAEAPAIRASRIVKSAAASSTSTPSGARVKVGDFRAFLLRTLIVWSHRTWRPGMSSAKHSVQRSASNRSDLTSGTRSKWIQWAMWSTWSKP